MSKPLLAPECDCGSRTTKARVDSENDLVAVRCDDCNETLITADILGAEFTGVKDVNAEPVMHGRFH